MKSPKNLFIKLTDHNYWFMNYNIICFVFNWYFFVNYVLENNAYCIIHLRKAILSMKIGPAWKFRYYTQKFNLVDISGFSNIRKLLKLILNKHCWIFYRNCLTFFHIQSLTSWSVCHKFNWLWFHFPEKIDVEVFVRVFCCVFT